MVSLEVCQPVADEQRN